MVGIVLLLLAPPMPGSHGEAASLTGAGTARATRARQRRDGWARLLARLIEEVSVNGTDPDERAR